MVTWIPRQSLRSPGLDFVSNIVCWWGHNQLPESGLTRLDFTLCLTSVFFLKPASPIILYPSTSHSLLGLSRCHMGFWSVEWGTIHEEYEFAWHRPQVSSLIDYKARCSQCYPQKHVLKLVLQAGVYTTVQDMLKDVICQKQGTHLY